MLTGLFISSTGQGSAFLLTSKGATPATADRKPTPEELAKIETVLRKEGFTRWKDIEFDDDDKVWEVDDAVGSDGREYYLKLDANSLAIVKREQSSSSDKAR